MSCGQPNSPWPPKTGCGCGGSKDKSQEKAQRSNFWSAVPPEFCTPRPSLDLGPGYENMSVNCPPETKTQTCGTPFKPCSPNVESKNIGSNFNQLCGAGLNCGQANSESAGSTQCGDCSPSPVSQATKGSCSPDSSPAAVPPSAELCEKFRMFARGVPENDPKKLAESCDNIIPAPLRMEECKGPEDQVKKPADLVTKLNENIEKFGTGACMEDNTKTETFEVTPKDCFLCPPMPSNVPLLSFPGWFECPPKITVYPYPVPPGARIKPISKGIRTNVERNPKCHLCGARRKNYDFGDKNCPAVRLKAGKCPGVKNNYNKNKKEDSLQEEFQQVLNKVTKGIKSIINFKW